MKASRTFCAPLALLAGAALVYATSFTWTGAQNSNWNGHNWTPNTGFPDDSSDSARIDVNTNNPVSFSTGTYTVDTIPINSDTNSQASALQVSGGSLTTSGRFLVKGDLNGANSAEIQVTGGTFAPQGFEFLGANNNANGHAKGNFDASASVAATTSGTTVVGFVDFDVVSGATFTAKDILIGNGQDRAELLIGNDNGTGEVDGDTMTIEVGDANGEAAVVRHTHGTLDVNGPIILTANASVDARAELYLSSGTTPLIDSILMYGGDDTYSAAYLDFAASVDLQDTTATLVTGRGEAKLGANVDFTCNELRVGDGTNIGDFELLDSSTVSARMLATSLVIHGGTGDGAYSMVKVTHNHGIISPDRLQ
jgi:hypothetical protein